MPAQSLAYATPDLAPERHANDWDGYGSSQADCAAAGRGCIEDSIGCDTLAALRDLPEIATLRDVIAAVLGERPTGHGQTYANVVLTQRALARLAEAASGRAVAPWEPAP